jgi:hypothetical protein
MVCRGLFVVEFWAQIGHKSGFMLKKFVQFLAISACGVLPLQAAIVWTGAVDTDIFNEANWDLSGSAVTAVDPNVTIADDVNFLNATVSITDVTGQQRFQVGNGFLVTVDNSSIIAAGNDGIAGPVGSALPAGPGGPVINVINGSAFEPFFIFQGVDLSIDGTSTATHRGGGNPINVSLVDLAPGAVVTFTAETVAAFNAEHLGKYTVNGVAAAEGVNITIASDGGAGSIITAIPEPSSFLLVGLAGVALILRRRK